MDRYFSVMRFPDTMRPKIETFPSGDENHFDKGLRDQELSLLHFGGKFVDRSVIFGFILESEGHRHHCSVLKSNESHRKIVVYKEVEPATKEFHDSRICNIAFDTVYCISPVVFYSSWNQPMHPQIKPYYGSNN